MTCNDRPIETNNALEGKKMANILTQREAYDVEDSDLIKCSDGSFREVEATFKYRASSGLRIGIKPVNFPSTDYAASDIIEVQTSA